MAIMINWLTVNINIVTVIVPPSTVMTGCTVTTTPLIIIINWSRELHPIVWFGVVIEPIST